MKKIILVDTSPTGPTGRIVEAAVAQGRKQSPQVAAEIEAVLPAQAYSKIANAPQHGVVVLVSTGEERLSGRQSDSPRVACESLCVAQSLASNFPKVPVYVLRHSDMPALGGIDVLAAAVAGVAGVADDRVLLADGALEFVLSHPAQDRRTRSVLVLGRSAPAALEPPAMLQEWEQNLGGDGTLDVACWRAVMALAQLPQLLPIAGLGDRYSFVKLAQALNLQRRVTSFQLSESDLRKALSSLADLWIQPSAHRSERVHLPRYARAHGFPQIQPVVSGITDEELPKRLYDAARTMIVENSGQSGHQVPRVIIRLPGRSLRKLQ